MDGRPKLLLPHRRLFQRSSRRRIVVLPLYTVTSLVTGEMNRLVSVALASWRWQLLPCEYFGCDLCYGPFASLGLKRRAHQGLLRWQTPRTSALDSTRTTGTDISFLFAGFRLTCGPGYRYREAGSYWTCTPTTELSSLVIATACIGGSILQFDVSRGTSWSKGFSSTW